MSSAPNGRGSSSDLDVEFLRVLDAQQGEEDNSEDQPSPSSSDERRETTILASTAASGNIDTAPAVTADSSSAHIEQSGLAHQYQSNTNEDYANSDPRDGGVDASSMPLQQLSTPSHESHTTTNEDTLSQALMNQVKEYNRLHQAHRQHTSSSETETGADCVANDDEDRLNHHTHTDHDIQIASLRDLIIESSEHKSDTNTIGTAHDLGDEVNRDKDSSVDIDQEILNAQEREYERLQQRRLQHEQEMESQANGQRAFDRLFPMCHIEGKGRGRFVQNFHLATSKQTDVNTCRLICASCNANLYTSPTAVLSFCAICKNITTTIQEGKTPE